MYVTLVTGRTHTTLGDSFSCYVQRAITGKACEEQVAAIKDECALTNFKAGNGRITMEQARAQCNGDIDKIVRANGGTADVASEVKSLTKLVVLGLFGVAAVGLTVGIATR